MNISGFACQGIRCIYRTVRVLGYGAKPAPNQINRQNRKYIHKNYYLPEAGHYIVPILVKPLYTIICKLIQVLVLPLYIKTIIGSCYFLVPIRKYPKKLSTGTALANHYYNSTQARKLAKRHPALVAGSKRLAAQTTLALFI